ncbi:hypothetical protein JI664_14815 [Rhodobacter sp. NTK016B]|uniref:hypothetical protein n=1 Tax=Rhodobacter sp. NTK016B TaxID=2759676 RepID=UPI001A906CB0|nr:hypothetical protein [Rhodobacter sp. NTK016B]MBN8293244.1 hypothetical protein [Rhodobacter sp. NTK016B]
MSQKLISEIETFIAETGLSEHRVGILLAGNGRLVGRLRKGSRVWPETECKIRNALRAERVKRSELPQRSSP